MRMNLGPKSVPTAKELAQLDELTSNMEEALFAREIATKLSVASGRKVSASDYQNWLEPESDAAYRRFDSAVKDVLGVSAYRAAEDAARVNEVLMVKLGFKVRPANEHHLAETILNLYEDRPTSRKVSKANFVQQPRSISMSRKQTVSEASVNTRIVKRTKKLIKLVVSGVKFGGSQHKVNFVARADKGFVVARTPGAPALRIGREVNAKGKESFTCRIGREVVGSKKTPQQAFAMGVQNFWNVA